MDAETRDMLADSLRSLLRSRSSDLITGLAELGWDDVVSDDEPAAIELLFTEQGRAGVASSALDQVIVAADGAGLTAAHEHPLVVHPFGSVSSSIACGRLRVDGVVLTQPTSDCTYLIAPRNVQSIHAVAADDVAPVTPIAGFDPASSLKRVRFDIAIGDTHVHRPGWEFANAAACRALAYELIGNGRAMLDVAVEHVGQRHQFGRPIGANQSPRHRLADAYVHLVAAHELVQVAWLSDRPLDATVAKAYAGYAAETTSRVCLQVCGAMGLTSEHSLAGYVRRSRILDALYGSWQHAMRGVGEQLLALRRLPRGVGL